MDTKDNYGTRLVERINQQESEITRLVGRITDMRAKMGKEKAKAFWAGRAVADEKITELQREAELWRESHLSDEKYWRDELTRLQKALDEMTLKSNAAHRDAAYWRDELTKLQNEALAECEPLSEVAKIYVQISPDMLARIMREELANDK